MDVRSYHTSQSRKPEIEKKRKINLWSNGPATDVVKHDMGEAGTKSVRICDQYIWYILGNDRISLFSGSIHGYRRNFWIYFMIWRIDIFGGKCYSSQSCQVKTWVR